MLRTRTIIIPKHQNGIISDEKICHRFYQYIKSKKELEKNDSINPREDFYYGDIDANNRFCIGYHGRQQSGNAIDNGLFWLNGIVQQDETCISIQYQFKRRRSLLTVYSIIAVAQFLVGLATIKDSWVLASIVTVLSILLWCYGVFNPFEQKNLLKILYTIFS